MFQIKDEDDLIAVIANSPKAELEHHDELSREYVEIEIDVMKYVNYDSVTIGISKRCQAAVVSLQERYNCFYNELYLDMTWLHPQYWQEGPNNGEDKMLQLINYFEVPLAAANFDKTKDLNE